jgi:hypothetical protein
MLHGIDERDQNADRRERCAKLQPDHSASPRYY